MPTPQASLATKGIRAESTGTTFTATGKEAIIGIKFIALNGFGAGLVITLPDPTTVPPGKPIVIADEAGMASKTNTAQVKSAVGTINGTASVLIYTKYGSLTVYSDGTQWLASGVVLGQGWADNTGAVTVGEGVDTILASVFVTPQMTGKFRIIGTIGLQNADGAQHNVTLKVGHGGGPTVDYTGGTVSVPAGNVIVYGAIQFDTTVAAALGVDSQLDIIGNAAGGSGVNVTTQANYTQITAQELSS